MQQPKYKIGQKVYYIKQPICVKKIKIREIRITKNSLEYHAPILIEHEKYMYLSLEELKTALHAQVDALEEPKND